MTEYQNIFTRVQIRGPLHHGVPIRSGPFAREGKTLLQPLHGA